MAACSHSTGSSELLGRGTCLIGEEGDGNVNTSGSSSAWDDDGNRYCSGPAFTVKAFSGKGNRTDVRLNLEMNSPFTPGSPPYIRGRSSRNTFSLLPTLVSQKG